MYDPVTARFLQADTYLGNLNDPLSLNLYTYCLNNPQKYVDPSGHIPLPIIIAALVGFVIGAGGEIYTQVVVEERYELDVKMILFEGAFNAVVAVTGAWGASIGAAAARQAGKLTMRMVVNTVAKEAALGALEGASHSILRQFAEGKNMNQVNMGRVWSETVSGGLSGAFGGIIGVGADMMKQARTAVSGNVAKNARVLDGVDEVVENGRDSYGMVDGKTPASRLADKLRGLSNSKRPNTVAVIRTSDAKYYVGYNKAGIYNQDVQDVLDYLGNSNLYERQCAEVNAISRAYNKGANLNGATISIASVRKASDISGTHGMYKAPCNVCQPLIDFLNIKDIK